MLLERSFIRSSLYSASRHQFKRYISSLLIWVRSVPGAVATGSCESLPWLMGNSRPGCYPLSVLTPCRPRRTVFRQINYPKALTDETSKMHMPPQNYLYAFGAGVEGGGGSAFAFLRGARSTCRAVSHSDSTAALFR